MPVLMPLDRVLSSAAAEDGPSAADRLLVRMFGQSFARWLSAGAGAPWRAALEGAPTDLDHWRRRMTDALYREIIGPQLGASQAHLTQNTNELLVFWEAVRCFSRWLTDLLWAEYRGKAEGVVTGFEVLTAPAEPLPMLMEEPAWGDSVLLTGPARLVLQVPGRETWCMIVMDTGRRDPEDDLLQAAWHHMAIAAKRQPPSGAMMRIGCASQIEERLFAVEKISAAQTRLRERTAKLAGVLGPGDETALRPEGERSEVPELWRRRGAELEAAFLRAGCPLKRAAEPLVGPRFVRYPVYGAALSEVRSATDFVQTALDLPRTPLILPTDGFLAVDLERPDRRVVTFESIRGLLPAPDPVLGISSFPAGVDPGERIQFIDLARPEHAHILVAGKRGSGKTEWMRSALAALLTSNDPDTLRLILIDPSGEAFGDFSHSRFLIGPDAIVNPAEIAPVEVLQRLVEEMDDRCRFLQDAGAENRDEFVARTGRRIPRILFVCDEVNDLMAADRPRGAELENLLLRLGKRSRRAGIHLIFATREPGRRLVEGTLNAVFPARIGMRMNRADESFFVLGQAGGENLLGRGDLLFRDVGFPVRLQAPLVSREDRLSFFGA